MTITAVPRLTDEQARALDAILDGLRRNVRVQTLGGYAGTGKSTLIRHLKEQLPTFAVAAPTGKAANVLRRKGLDASTIHSLIYDVQRDPITDRLVFRRRFHLPCRGIIVDEASMVGRDLHDDLARFDLPLVFVGDHGQLEPVNSDFNLMAEPDHRLETIHRNAGTISRFAEWLRMGRDARKFPVGGDDQVEIISAKHIDERELWTGVDQVICAYNKTRVQANALIRERLGYADRLPEVGERVMCLKNNRDLGVFNGMQGTVLDYRRQGGDHFLDFESYGQTYHDLDVHPDQFGSEKTLHQDRGDNRIPFDFAYCITCHKSQGDEFDSVLVLEQRCSAWDHKRWAYTAASRARKKIYWARGF